MQGFWENKHLYIVFGATAKKYFNIILRTICGKDVAFRAKTISHWLIHFS